MKKFFFFLLLYAGLFLFPCPSGTYALDKPLYALEWDMNLDAVGYELSVFTESEGQELPVYHKAQVWQHTVILNADDFSPAEGALFWKVRPFNLDGDPIGEWSEAMDWDSTAVALEREAPRLRNDYQVESGMTLLYPVYSYTGLPGMASYEIEVDDDVPENPDSAEPSVHRIWAGTSPIMERYDEEPRIGTIYWRVRGMDADGNPVGVWSEARKIENVTEGWRFGLFGDSISHGGGRMSFAPSDAAYSLTYYLEFPTVNLAQSGDTSRMMLERFDRDVLPFHPEYLLIMGGTNSLRGGEDPSSVIYDLQEIGNKCRANGIVPIYLTLAPINPENIRRCFDEDTVADWQARFAAVNQWIRTQDHIDTAAPFAGMGLMPTEYAVDGVHGDWRAKVLMGDEINRHISEFIK